MRRKDREITNIEGIMEIIKKCDVCSLAFFDEEYPYIIPLNFGASLVNKEITLYFHGANVGKKLELIRKNPKVSFEMNCSHKLILGESPCNSTMEYESVCGNGKAVLIQGEEKLKGLNLLMKQYTSTENHKFDENVVNGIVVFKIIVNEVHGKVLKRK